jgi:cbb3-type cytochrome oxidase subunit 3
MNRSQKFSVFLIIFLLVSIAVAAPVYIYLFVFGRCPSFVRIAPAILLVVYIGGFFWALRKQSKNEPETDELDVAIQKMAAIISFVSVLIVVGVLLIIANLVWGLNAAVPLWVLMLSFGSLVPIMLVIYCIAILVQYGRRGKNGQ